MSMKAKGRVRLVGIMGSKEALEAYDPQQAEPCEWLEFRADMAGFFPLDSAQLATLGMPVIFSLRSAAYGGRFRGTPEDRASFMEQAATHCQLVELEAQHDLNTPWLEKIPPHKRLVAWYGQAQDGPYTVEAMLDQVYAMKQTPARYYKLVLPAHSLAESLVPLKVLAHLAEEGHSDVVAYAQGTAGLWTQLLGPHLGGAMVYGSLHLLATTETYLPVSRLAEDYGFPALRRVTEVYGLVGSNTYNSRLPGLYNHAFSKLGIDALFLPWQVEDFEGFWQAMVVEKLLDGMNFRLNGMQVVAPHQGKAFAHAHVVNNPLATMAKAGNLLIRNSDRWEATTTDSTGVLAALHARELSPFGLKIAVLGAEGSGRTLATALNIAGAHVTLVHAMIDEGTQAAQQLGIAFVPLIELKPGIYDVVVNAVPDGLRGAERPFDLLHLKPETVVIDTVLRNTPTALVQQARQLKVALVEAEDMLAVQFQEQFRLLTRHVLPEKLAELLVEERRPS